MSFSILVTLPWIIKEDWLCFCQCRVRAAPWPPDLMSLSFFFLFRKVVWWAALWETDSDSGFAASAVAPPIMCLCKSHADVSSFWVMSKRMMRKPSFSVTMFFFLLFFFNRIFQCVWESEEVKLKVVWDCRFTESKGFLVISTDYILNSISSELK